MEKEMGKGGRERDFHISFCENATVFSLSHSQVKIRKKYDLINLHSRSSENS
jgi:hypothetical protein